MKRAGELNASTALEEVKQGQKRTEEKRVGRPAAQESKAKLQVYVAEELMEQAKIHCIKNKLTLSQYVENLLKDEFKDA